MAQDEDKGLSQTEINLASFGIPDQVTSGEPDEETDEISDDTSEEEEDDESQSEDELDEDTDDDEAYELEVDSDTDRDEPDDADLRKALKAARKREADMQSERDKLRQQLSNISVQYSDLSGRLLNLEQSQAEQADPVESLLEERDDDDYVPVSQLKKALKAKRPKQQAVAPQTQQYSQPPQSPVDQAWLYSQPDYGEVIKYVAEHKSELENDVTFNNLGTQAAYFRVQAVMAEKKLAQIMKKSNSKRSKKNRKPPPPKVGGDRVRSQTRKKADTDESLLRKFMSQGSR